MTCGSIHALYTRYGDVLVRLGFEFSDSAIKASLECQKPVTDDNEVKRCQVFCCGLLVTASNTRKLS